MRNVCTYILQVFIWLGLPSTAYSLCMLEPASDAAIRAGYNPSNRGLIACKVMPDRPEQSVVAYITDRGSSAYTLTVLVVANATAKITHRFIDEAPMFGPSGDPTKIAIDTARYVVAPKRRAFGVRVVYSLNPWEETEDLSLFLSDGIKLNRVLSEFPVSISYSRGCFFDGYTTKRQIALSQTLTNGFYDLIVSTRKESYESIVISNAECSTKEAVSSEQHALIYSFGSYSIPSGFR